MITKFSYESEKTAVYSNPKNEETFLMSKRKKFLQKNCTFVYRVLRNLQFKEYYLLRELYRELRVSKQYLYYYLKKLEKEDFVTQPFHGSYKITESGKNFLEQLEIDTKKNKTRLENMRYKYPIHSDVDNLVTSLVWKKTRLHNLDVYHGKFEGYSLRLFSGKNPSIEITSKQWYGTNPHQITWESRNDVENVMYRFCEKFDVKLGMSEPSMRPDFAVPSKLAEDILKSQALSQLKSESAVLNKSSGRDYDWETHDIESAQLVLDMPFMMKQLSKEINDLKNQQNKILQILENLSKNNTIQACLTT